MQANRITVLAGHYGSGKTTLALALARGLHAQGMPVTLCDLDIVNPYFRTADDRKALEKEGIAVIASPFAGTNVDAPAMPAATQAIFDDPSRWAVIDLGGDDRGALALGRYAAQIKAAGANMWMVINPFRPLTRSVEDIQAVRVEIETAARVPFTGIVNNANLGGQTDVQQIADSLPFAREVAKALALPLAMTTVPDALLGAVQKAVGEKEILFPVSPFAKDAWKL